MELREYQKELIDQCRTAFKKNKRVIACLPTGGGKSLCFSEITRLAAENGTICLIAVHRKELFSQTVKVLKSVGIRPELLNADTTDFAENADVVVAMVETLKRRLKYFKEYSPGFIILDECHLKNFNKIIDSFPNAKVLGVTATPKGDHIYKYYTKIVQPIDTPELIEKGYLVKDHAYQMKDDFSDLKIAAGEYTTKSLYGHFNKKNLYDGVVTHYKERAAGKKTLVFNVNIEHTINQHKEFLSAGIKSGYITYDTPKKEREETLEKFHTGEIMVMNNCGILTTGYDEPSIECIILNRKTKSEPLFLQMMGRGSRPFEGKTEFIVLDFGMNHETFGLWSDPRHWEIRPPKKKDGVAPLKDCPECEALIHLSLMICPHCSFEFPKDEALSSGYLVDLSEADQARRRISTLTIQELANLKQKQPFIWRILRSRGLSAIQEFAKIKGHKPGWEWHQEKEMHDCKFQDIWVSK